VTTEDLVFMLEAMGIDTGCDIHRLLLLRQKVAQWLDGETLHGSLSLAGLPKTFSTGFDHTNFSA
jgi:hydroxymethylglutaryl-CoA lyase